MAELPEEARRAGSYSFPVEMLVCILVERGRPDEARELASLFAGREASDDVQDRAYAALALAALARAGGDHAEALERGEAAFEEFIALGDTLHAVDGLAEATGAALTLGELGRADALLARCAALRPVDRTIYLQAQEARLGARVAAARAETGSVEAGFRRASAAFRELGMRFWLGATLLEHAEWLSGEGRAVEAGPLLDEAREIFEQLEALPWLERLDRVAGAPSAAVA